MNVDRHRQSVAWIKLCIIENGCSVPARARAAGGGWDVRERRVGCARFARRALSDELGYASGDGRHRITVDFARHSRHVKYNLQSRAVRVSSARESVHTRASFGKTEKSHPPEPPTNAAPRSPRSRQMVCSIGVMAAREVCPITTPAPRGTSVAKRKTVSSPASGVTGRGARASSPRARRVRKKVVAAATIRALPNEQRARPRAVRVLRPRVSRVVPYVRDARAR